MPRPNLSPSRGTGISTGDNFSKTTRCSGHLRACKGGRHENRGDHPVPGPVPSLHRPDSRFLPGRHFARDRLTWISGELSVPPWGVSLTPLPGPDSVGSSQSALLGFSGSRGASARACPFPRSRSKTDQGQPEGAVENDRPDRTYLMDLFKKFPDNATAERWFEEVLWGPQGVHCPRCGNRTSQCPNRKPYRCRTCRKPFDVLTGTPLEGSRIPLFVWAICVHLFMYPKGVSPKQLSRRDLDIALSDESFVRDRRAEAFLSRDRKAAG